MRKYLYILTLLVALMGCNDADDVVTTSSETRVNTFTFYKDTTNLGLTETIYIVEHLSDTGRIYSRDSLRYGTRLDSVVPLVTYKATPGSAVFYLPNDTVMSTGADTLDFTKDPIYLEVQSSDFEHKRVYRIDIKVHQQDPNLYVWKQVSSNLFSPQSAPQYCDMKAFYIGGVISLFVNDGFRTSIHQSVDGSFWKEIDAPTGLPTPCAVRDILQHHDRLYYADGGVIYTTDNLVDWTTLEYTSTDYSVVNMLLSFDDKPWCILQHRLSEQLYLGVLQGGDVVPVKDIYGLQNGALPQNFPISDFAALPFRSSSERPRAMIVGGRTMDGTAVNTRWNLEYELSAGYRMVDFSIEQPSFNSLTGISIIQYNNHLIMFGGIDNDLTYRSNILYSYDEGMNWSVPDTAQNRLPDSYNSRQKPSVVVDGDDNIYIIGGQNNTQVFSDVYRGYLNSMKW